MPAPEFLFTIALSGEAPDHQMLTDMLQQVFERLGIAADAADRLVLQLRSQVRDAAYTLQCQARGGELQIVLTQAGHEWRAACDIPPQ